MPWETRGARLCTERQENEHFSRETWFQADFLDANLRMPFEVDFFDLVICGHTIEDLSGPGPVLNEIGRVGKSGVIECPSRLAEQTIGISDRMSSVVGYQHHHWIVDIIDGRLCLYSKAASKLAGRSIIPQSMAERMLRAGHLQNVQYFWEGSIDYDICVHEEVCSSIAREYAAQTEFGHLDRVGDSLVRLLRRVKSNRRLDPAWWEKIVEISRPYSSIEI